MVEVVVVEPVVFALFVVGFVVSGLTSLAAFTTTSVSADARTISSFSAFSASSTSEFTLSELAASLSGLVSEFASDSEEAASETASLSTTSFSASTSPIAVVATTIVFTVHLPSETAVTTPFSSTVAIFSSLDS